DRNPGHSPRGAPAAGRVARGRRGSLTLDTFVCSSYKQRAVSTDALPRHQARATRETGRRTRSALLDAAARLFAERGLAGASLAGLAAAAEAFPSQVTYHFGSKEALSSKAASPVQ